MSDEMYEMFCARAVLEGMVAGFAADNMNWEEKQELMGMTERFQRLVTDDDEKGFLDLDQQFHFKIYQCLKTQMLKNMVEQLYVLTKRNRDAGFQIKGRGQQVIEEHYEITRAICNGNRELSEAAGIKHHENHYRLLKTNFEYLKEEHSRR